MVVVSPLTNLLHSPPPPLLEKAKDVEMKDGETPEPGSLSEPGAHQAVSVLGIALIAMGEDIGAEMALRIFNHLVRGHHGQGKAVGESTVRESSRGGGGVLSGKAQ